MSYTCKQAIIDQLSACGPQSMEELRRYCHAQALDYSLEVYFLALLDLGCEGKIWEEIDCDEVTYTNGC
jgi:hypothetical protein